MIQQVCLHFLLIVWVNLEFTPFPWVIFENIKKFEFKNLKFNSLFFLFTLWADSKCPPSAWVIFSMRDPLSSVSGFWTRAGKLQGSSKKSHSVLLCYTAIGHFKWVRWDPKWPWAPWQWEGMTFQAFRGSSGAQIAFTILLATSIGDKMLYSD